jgi:hypothetical protein
MYIYCNKGPWFMNWPVDFSWLWTWPHTCSLSLIIEVFKLQPMSQTRPTICFVNKVLSKQSHPHLFTYYLWPLSYSPAELCSWETL